MLVGAKSRVHFSKFADLYTAEADPMRFPVVFVKHLAGDSQGSGEWNIFPRNDRQDDFICKLL